MKFTSILLGALATATAVSASKPKSSAAPSSKYEDDCDDYPESEPHYPSSKKYVPVHVSSTPCSDVDYPKSTYCPSSKVPVKHSSAYKPKYPYPVVTKTVIVVVPTFTKKCYGPTTIIKFDQTIIVTIEGETCVTFSKGPYTRTKTELECATTTTDYFEIDECPTGWPYATGQTYVPLPCSECAPVAVAPVPVVPLSPATAIAAVPAVSDAVSAPGAKVSSPVAIFTSGASHAQAGVIALIAGVVAAMMVL